MRYSGEQWKVEKTEGGLRLSATTARHELLKSRVLFVKENVVVETEMPVLDELGAQAGVTKSSHTVGEVWECTRDGKNTLGALIDCNPDIYVRAASELAKESAK